MPPSRSHEVRITRLEDGLGTINAKQDTVLTELRALGNSLIAHVKEDAAVERRVHDLEQTAVVAEKRAQSSAEDHKNVKSALWLAGLTVLGDILLQVGVHLHLIP